MATIEMRVDANPEKLAEVLYYCTVSSEKWQDAPEWNDLAYQLKDRFQRLAREFIKSYTGI